MTKNPEISTLCSIHDQEFENEIEAWINSLTFLILVFFNFFNFVWNLQYETDNVNFDYVIHHTMYNTNSIYKDTKYTKHHVGQSVMIMQILSRQNGNTLELDFCNNTCGIFFHGQRGKKWNCKSHESTIYLHTKYTCNFC